MASDEDLLLEHIELLKDDKARLAKELEATKQPYFSATGVQYVTELTAKAGAAIAIIGVISAVLYGLYWLWPSDSGPTGRFYVIHHMHDYKKPPAVKWEPEMADCYKVVSEFNWGQDDNMTACIRDKDEAYTIANDFADKWKTLEGKAQANVNE